MPSIIIIRIKERIYSNFAKKKTIRFSQNVKKFQSNKMLPRCCSDHAVIMDQNNLDNVPRPESRQYHLRP